jgi:hypothetical protein
LKVEQKFEENPVLKLEQKLESRTENHAEEKVGSKGSISIADNKELLGYWSKTQSLVQKWHPNIVVVNKSINLFNDNVMQHFGQI